MSRNGGLGYKRSMWSDGRRARDWLFGLHAALALLFVCGRALAHVPATSVRAGAQWSSTLPGEAAIFGALLGACAAFAAILVLTWRSWRDPRALLLFAAFAAALADRRAVDVFDLVYLALAAIAAVVWFDGDRPHPPQPAS